MMSRRHTAPGLRRGPAKSQDARGLASRLAVRPAVPRESDGLVRSRSAARLVLVGALVLLGYGLLFAKASALMLFSDQQIEDQARGQFEASVQVRGRRGDLLDRHGVILASTVDLAELHVDPSLLSDEAKHRMATSMASALELDATSLERRLRVPGRRDVRLMKGLRPQQLSSLRATVAADEDLEAALFSRRDRKRVYPGAGDAAALLGVVGRGGVGLGGLERALQSQLRGQVVRQVYWQDRKGNQVTLDEEDAAPGNTVILTIDRGIQHITEQALATSLKTTGASAAYAVVVDVPTGEILAMASVPGLDPNDQAHLDIARLKNRAAMNAIEPGSVFKPFIAAAALDTGTVTASTPLYCEMGAWRLGRKTIHDEHRLGDATLGDVIKFSSNICAAKLALALGPENALGYLSDFGFGRSSGLGLPGETHGMLRKVEGIRRIELATTGYGYGSSVSAIQLAAAVATLGNGGVRMEPRLIKAVRNGRGELVERYPPTVDRRVVSEQVARQVVDMMVAVTEEHGTGTRAAVCGYKVAGKTGTANKLIDGAYSHTQRIGSWIGLIPADAPKLAIAVVVDTPTLVPRFGGWTAGPAFKEIAGESMRLLGVPPDPALYDQMPQCDDRLARGSKGAPAGGLATNPIDSPKPAPVRPPVELRWNDDGTLRTPDLAGLSMRDALVALEGAGLGLRVSGSGRVQSQNPLPGAPLAPGDAVVVALR